MKVLIGGFYCLIAAVITFFLYVCLAPIFSLLPMLLPTAYSEFYTPGLESTYNFVLNTGWVWLILWVLISAIIVWFAQVFQREQRQEEYYY